jgi:AcrR family transcriptional regulator
VSRVEPSNARSRRTRAALLAATRALLEDDGFAGLTMAAVAERAGVTRRAIYLHFPSRADLIAALFEYVTESEGLSESTRPVWEASDAVTALDEWAGHVARFHPKVRAVTRAFEQVQRTDPDAAGHRARYLEEQLQACRQLIRWLDQDGRLAPGWTIETASAMLWSLISTDILDRLIDEQGWAPKRFATNYALLLRSAFVTKTPAQPQPSPPNDPTEEPPALSREPEFE